ncbi:uncharacterized protein N0V89_003218 [Didymosphaeria variabile]|uniref:Uncharacterized protein n=1 Tax=Didymosphaeria variabile TaxID=1932322 RepID=A0A9W8XU53_9PLEO|nr:uncharacterized protein N0V89_003218 [Didymosphaeria variabile]KAJ4358634.1 hypothetical protein N0V89_003218 [Didymosphaeria variabile]
MARRSNRSEMEGVEKPTSRPVPLSGYVAFSTQSSRNRLRNKTWRSALPSDLVQGEGLAGFHTDESSSPIESVESTQTLLSEGAPARLLPQPAQPRSTPFALPKIQTDIVRREDAIQMDFLSEQHPASPSEGSDNISPTDTRLPAVENHLRLFGKLPDIIRLQEQTGDFDGQIVFIGHPNRDVSAHQWLSDSYQWVHVGLWSHTRKRIEGSLASDRLATSGFSYNSIEYFKFVAEHRESTIKEHGRPQTEPEADVIEPTPTEVSIENIRKTPAPSFAVASVLRTVTGKNLEDPFITPVDLSPAPMATFSFRGGGDTVGSMDFNYEFPTKLGTPLREHQQIYVQRERARLEALRGQSITQREMQTPLREVDFGEEAPGLTPSPTRIPAGRQDTMLSVGDMNSRFQARSRLAELGQTTSQPSLTPEQRVAVPDFPLNNVSLRNSIPTGPTVANPYRGFSTLNATAPPYRMPTKEQTEASDSSATVFHNPASATDPALRFSDPDGMRQEHVHPIANGFKKQAPTRQNWNGPFFADSMPTAHDPLASLSGQISNEQKLVDWYRDGQSVSRQQDFAKTLVTAASTSSKARSFGAIGEGSARKQESSKYANTHVFARVYEHLSEYAEESRAGSGKSYFTRAWKPSPLHLRDLGPDGNNSFYSGSSTSSPQTSRTSHRPYQPYRGDSTPWGFGGLSSSTLPSQYGPNSATPGPYGGPSHRGF